MPITRNPKPTLEQRAFSVSSFPLRLCALGVTFLLVWVCFLLTRAPITRFDNPIPHGSPIVPILGPDASGMLWFAGFLVAAWTTYAFALHEVTKRPSRFNGSIIGIVSVAVTLVSILVYPGTSVDIWHNIADGRILWRLSLNPLLTIPDLVQFADPIVRRTTESQYILEPSYYGPLWYLLTLPATLGAGNSLIANLIAFKALPAVFFLLGIPLVSRVANGAFPGGGTIALLYYGWNPLLLWSSAVDGHNDIVMGLFILLSLHEVANRRWMTVIPILTLAVWVKFTAIILLPAIVIFAWSQQRTKALPSLLAGLAISAFVTMLLWAPLWVEPAFLVQRLQTASDRALNTPMAAVASFLSPEKVPLFDIHPVLRTLFTGAFLIGTAIVLITVWRGRSSTFQRHLWACATTLILYYFLLSWWFFPWYLCWVMPIGAILARERTGKFLLIFGASAMSIFVVGGWWSILGNGSHAVYNLVVVLLVFLPPLLFLLLSSAREARSRTQYV